MVSAPGSSQAGAAFIYERAGTGKPWHLAAPLTDPRHAAHDEYAWAVAISATKSGTYVAVGGNNDNGRPDFITIYKGSGTHWKRQATVPDPGPSGEDMFGEALAISATTLVVGASCENTDAGDIRIYVRSGTAWHLVASKSDPLDRAQDFFGGSVSVSGNRVLVGSADRAYVYTRSPRNRFVQTATISNPGVVRADFGWSVALQGATALIGAPGGLPGDGPSAGAGAAYVYQLKGKTWKRQVKLTAPASARGSDFGFSVALEQPNLLVGQPFFGTPDDCGTAFVFTDSRQKWREKTQIIDKPTNGQPCTSGGEFGSAVGLSGKTGIFGAPDANKQRGAFAIRQIP